MFFGIPGLIGLVIGIWLVKKNSPRKTRDSWGHMTANNGEISGWVMIVISTAAIFLGSILLTSIAYINQIGDRATITQLQWNQQIYKDKANNLTSQFKTYLAEKYPQMEERVMTQIAHAPHMLFTIYPQLQSSKTLSLLVDKIQELQGKVYDQQLALTKIAKDMRVRTQNPFYLPFVIPSGPWS